MMTVEYNANAKRIVDDYLHAVRDRLRASESVDAEEVLNELSGHMEKELAELNQPVSEADVNQVLDRLGSPEQVVGEEDMSWWRKMILRLRRGPEDWRLAYLSFGVLILGTLLGPLGLIGSFLLSRAAVTLVGEPHPPAKKWLIYPSLLIVYSLIVFFALSWPVYAYGELVSELEGGQVNLLYKEPLFDNDGFGTVIAVLAGGGLGLSIWWSLLWVVGRSRPYLIRAIFKPFADQWTGRTFGKFVLGVWVLTIILAATTILCWVLT